MENIYHQRVEALRSIMSRRGWDAVIITGSDPHCSEYPAVRWKQVEWISGFTGEAGDIVITADHAGLWTDTRYFIQANRQLSGTGIVLHKTRVPDQVLIPEWLSQVAFRDRRRTVIVAVDGLCQSVSAIRDIQEAFGVGEDDEPACRIVDVPDMMDTLWIDRPQIPQTPVISLGTRTAGESRWGKLTWLRAAVREQGADSILITALDEIAWTLNVRGSDIEYNPLVISHLLVTPDEVDWFVRKDSYDAADQRTLDTFCELEEDDISIFPYDDIDMVLAEKESDGSLGTLFVDSSTLNYSLYKQLGSRIIEGVSPVVLRKAVKNETEIKAMRAIHVDDGAAMEKFLYWLEGEVQSGRGVSEWDASLKLDSYRSEIPGYMGDSFETISAYGPGGALPHYVTPRKDAPMLEPHGLYLCDSGGQYLSGTTDITRTIPLGPCTALEKEDYTLVLKGHIDLAMAVFPRGTAGCQIDALARNPLWRCKRNFGHGTGHGVGFFLGVHEGPQDIRQNFNRQPIVPGMITSDEPGIYREGMHGVRHENLVLCVEAGRNDFGEWLEFETLTLCHFDTGAIVRELLDKEEIDWLNAYNERVYRTLAPKLPSHIAAWLRLKTEAI
ncbi:MAG: aminopeptidase P family protein [Bacteroidales bacterium]|nr:aminopeptidase P family protein [Candidatus Cryptobacteroides onthequi]MCQ2165165.1 aminopeptidase P family protein [Bacteroidales bacterium]